MALPAQGRLPYAVPLHRNWLYVCHTGSYCRLQFSRTNKTYRYSNARLLEINSHSLFSKWFSESGKLVQRLFSGINELIEEEEGFVVVLIGKPKDLP